MEIGMEIGMDIMMGMLILLVFMLIVCWNWFWAIFSIGPYVLRSLIMLMVSMAYLLFL